MSTSITHSTNSTESESESSIVLPISNVSTEHSANMMRESGSTTKSGKPTRRVSENTQGALEALVSFSTTTVNKSASQQQDQIIPSHQTQTTASLSSDEDSVSMPPPPPRSPTTMLAARDLLSGASRCTVEPISIPQPSFTFLHDSTRFSNMDAPNYTSSSSTTVGRLRSASNPEGFEKWDLYSRRNDRQHFVLPSSILEEELASTRRVLGEVPDDNGEVATTATTTSITTAAVGFQQHWSTTGVRKSKRNIARLGRLGTSPDSVSDLGEEDESSTPSSSRASNKKSSSNINNSKTSKKKSSSGKQRNKLPPKLISKSPPPDELDDNDEESLEPEELLRRARSRLLEDLSEGGENRPGAGMNGEAGSDKNGMMILPHSLSKYKEVYNKNGRIGIYTPAERAAIIQKFNAKRARRVWNKKIRYNCRKNLADRRMRVKGRFVKRSVSEAAPPPEEVSVVAEEEVIKAKKNSPRSSSPPTSGSPLPPVVEEEGEQPMDEDMPDVNDEEAGFDPSEDMPYRRTRRYTIT